MNVTQWSMSKSWLGTDEGLSAPNGVFCHGPLSFDSGGIA